MNCFNAVPWLSICAHTAACVVFCTMTQKHHHASSSGVSIPYIAFDYHSECRGGSTKNLAKLRDFLKKYVNGFNYFHCSEFSIERCEHNSVSSICSSSSNKTRLLFSFQLWQKKLQFWFSFVLLTSWKPILIINPLYEEISWFWQKRLPPF